MRMDDWWLKGRPVRDPKRVVVINPRFVVTIYTTPKGFGVGFHDDHHAEYETLEYVPYTVIEGIKG